MIAPKDERNLRHFLSLAADPDIALSYTELQGFLFGLAMTPESLPPDQWIPVIHGGEPPVLEDEELLDQIVGSLTTTLNTMVKAFQADELHLPFAMDELDEEELANVYEWVSGFEEALALREELWDPANAPQLKDNARDELLFSLLVVQGLVDPVEALEYFRDLPESAFAEAFGDGERPESREMQIQFFLMASLPLTIATLQAHSRWQEEQLKKVSGHNIVAFPGAGKGLEAVTGSGGKTTTDAKVIRPDFGKKGR